ncbi:hypothetical protein ACFLWT_01610 [Chloroflexota bacterium]
MSKFIDRLNQVSQAELQSMGFRTTQLVSEKPKILLIASLAQASVGDLANYMTGADAGLLRIPKLSAGVKIIKEMSQMMPDIPWGGWLRDIGQKGIKQIVKAGCDFVVFPTANTPLAILQDSEVGKILEVEASLSEGLLRTANELPVDAVLVAGEQEEHFLTWHHLMLFQHFADLLTKPLLVSIPSNVEANELQALWEAGVDGVVTEVGVGQPAERLKKLRQIIDNLVFPSQHKQEKVKPLLPYISNGASKATEEEEE